MATRFVLGTMITTSVAFLDRSGVLTDPGVITVRIEAPDETITTYTTPDLVRDSAGRYHLDFLPDAVGTWDVEWAGSDGLSVVGSGSVFIDNTTVGAPDVI